MIVNDILKCKVVPFFGETVYIQTNIISSHHYFIIIWHHKNREYMGGCDVILFLPSLLRRHVVGNENIVIT